MKVGNQTSNPVQVSQLKDNLQNSAGIRGAKIDSPESEKISETDISERAKEMATAKKLAIEAPDVREEKIRMLKERIANKEYNVKPEDVADRLVKEHLERQ